VTRDRVEVEERLAAAEQKVAELEKELALVRVRLATEERCLEHTARAGSSTMSRVRCSRS